MKNFLFLTFLFLFPFVGNSQTLIDTSIKKTFIWHALMVDNNLNGTIEEDEGDKFIIFSKNGRLILDYQDFSSAGNLCSVYSSLPELDGDGNVDFPTINLKDIELLRLPSGTFSIRNKYGDRQLMILGNPEDSEGYSLVIFEPSLIKGWF